MVFGIIRKIKANIVIDNLRKRRTISNEEADAMTSYVIMRGNPDLIKIAHRSRAKVGKQRKGDTKLLYITGYYYEIQRKIEDHIYPFVEKRGMYRVLR